MAWVAGQPAAGRQRASPEVGAVLLVHCGIWVADRRCQETTVAVWGAVVQSAARRAQKTQKKAVSRRSKQGTTSLTCCSEQDGEADEMQRFQSSAPRRSPLQSSGACFEVAELVSSVL